MNTNSIDLVKLLQFGMGNLDWNTWVDRYNEKYNELNVDGFTFSPMTLMGTYAQLVSSAGIKALPTWVDPDSPGYETTLRQFSGETGDIPTAKAFSRINSKILKERMRIIQQVGQGAFNASLQETLFNLFDEGTENLIAGYRNALTHMRHQVVSKGSFTLSADNNPRGLKGIELTYGIKDDHRIDIVTPNSGSTPKATAFWTKEDHSPANEGTASDPLKWLRDTVKDIRRKWHYYGPLTMELTSDLWDDLATHTKVLGRIGAQLYPNVEDADTVLRNAQNESEERVKSMIKNYVKVDEVKLQDSYAVVNAPGIDEDGLPDIIGTTIENFKKENIVFRPSGNIGDIQGVQPMTVGIRPEDTGWFDGGRLLLTQRPEAKTKSIYFDSEFAQLPVLNMPQYHFICTVTK